MLVTAVMSKTRGGNMSLQLQLFNGSSQSTTITQHRQPLSFNSNLFYKAAGAELQSANGREDKQ